MNIILGKLILLFVLLIVLMKCRLNLSWSMGITILAGFILYGFGWSGSLDLLKTATFTWDTFSLVATVYAIFVIQGLLEARGELKKAQENLSALFNNRRLNSAVAPVFIGLLPSAAAVTIAGEIVRDTCKDDIPIDLQAFITTFFRHIPESILPTYVSIILMCSLSGVALSAFVLLQIPMTALCFLTRAISWTTFSWKAWAFLRRVAMIQASRRRSWRSFAGLERRCNSYKGSFSGHMV